MLAEESTHHSRLFHPVSTIAFMMFHAEMKGPRRNLVAMVIVVRKTHKVHARETLRSNPNGQENRGNCDIVIVLKGSSTMGVGKKHVRNIRTQNEPGA
jgi:hypothetical protein